LVPDASVVSHVSNMILGLSSETLQQSIARLELPGENRPPPCQTGDVPMNTTLLRMLPCFLWAAFAIASAAPASAFVLTGDDGNYASCSSDVSATGYMNVDCSGGQSYDVYYQQRIKMIDTSCSQGGCAAENAATYVQFIYNSGRKSAWYQGYCAGYNVYGLDTCAC
jgi:hypothetical protein